MYVPPASSTSPVCTRISLTYNRHWVGATISPAPGSPLFLILKTDLVLSQLPTTFRLEQSNRPSWAQGGGEAVSVGDTSVSVGGTGVSVGGTGVSVGGTGVSVGGIGVSVGGIGVSVGGTGVSVGGSFVGGLHQSGWLAFTSC